MTERRLKVGVVGVGSLGQHHARICSEIPEIDLVVSGGGQEITRDLEETDGGSFIVHADLSTPGHAGRRIGSGSWIFDRQNTIVDQQWKIVSLNTTYPDDPDMYAWVIKHQQP